MKTTDKIFKCGVMAGISLAMMACSEEKIYEPSAAGLPLASDYQIGVTVDDLNNIELNILDKNGAPAKGVFPVWYVNGSTRPSTLPTYRDLITIAGDYPVEMKVGNANGISEGSQIGTIHIEKTIFDFAPYMKALTDNAVKEWTVAGDKDGNMGCGPAANPTEWWNGGPGAKEAEGVYANVLTFADNGDEKSGKYTFDPASSGTIYVNTGINSLPGLDVNNPGDGNDFRVPVSSAQETTFELVPIGANLYLTFPANTLFPYIPSTQGFAEPKYRITSFNKTAITLVQDLEGISWQYIIAPKGEADVTTAGFNYNGEHNLWKDANVTVASTWFANGDWAELPDQPQVELTATKGIRLHTPAATGPAQWQGQVHVESDINVTAGETYDFSCKVDVPTAGKVTVKVQKLGDDNTSFISDQVDVDAGGSIVWFSDKAGFDGTVKIAFDFGGYADSDIEVSNIVLKEHKYDDGTKIPSSSKMPSFDDASNLFAGYEILKTSTWFADGGWAMLATQPEINLGDGFFSFVAPAGVGPDQWQGQVHNWTNVAVSADKNYDFCLTIESDNDISGVTVKIQKGDSLDEDKDTDDGVAFSIDRVDVEGGVPYVYWFENKPGFDSNGIQVCMDFGGVPEGSKVRVSDIKLQEHK